jgi:hypothetical protein
MLRTGLKWATLFLIVAAQLCHADTCKYGLTSINGNCYAQEAEALQRVAAAKTICMSGNTSVTWNKSQKEPQWAWADIQAGELDAIKDFPPKPCAQADLVVKYVYDDAWQTVTITVTDAESSATVFEEQRKVADLLSDAIRMANHWRGMVVEAREAANTAKEAAREELQQAKLREKLQQCQSEFDSLKQVIISYTDNQKSVLPQSVVNQIATHNNACSNTISPEGIRQQQLAAASAKSAQQAAQESAMREKTLGEIRVARMDKLKVDMLAAWQASISSAPFVAPSDGWMQVAPLPNILSYIILPNGQTSDCHFTSEHFKPVLDCLGPVGRNQYFAVQSNDRWYLLKSKWTGSGNYAGTVKDGGSTICLRGPGCYHVLAEIRPQPTALPNKLQVPTPSKVTLEYGNEDFSFSYPENWKAEERRNNEKLLVSVNVAAPEAHLSTWVTHGFFIGHVNKMSTSSQTLEGAYKEFATIQRERGLVIDNTKTAVMTVGDTQGKLTTFSQPTPFNFPENGWISVIKDKGAGYYWILMFYPSNDDNQLYSQTFASILKSFKFKK